MRIKTQNSIIIDEIIAPGLSSFEGLDNEQIKEEVYDIVKCSSGGVGLDLALYLLDTADWGPIFLKTHDLINRKKN